MRRLLNTWFQPWWQARTPRERRLLIVMAFLLGISISWFGVLLPLSAIARNNHEAVLQLEADTAYLAALVEEIAQLRRKPMLTPLPARDLLMLLQQAIQASGFAQTGLTLATDGQMAVRMTGETSFDEWMKLVAQLAQYYHVHLVKLHINATLAPEQVKLDALFVHAGGSA